MAEITAFRARSMVPLAGEAPARGEQQLFAPLRRVDDAVLLCADGQILEAGRWGGVSLPAGVEVRDLGDVCLAPGLINAHCHVQLAHVAGRTCWGEGFTAWLRSLVPLLHEGFSEEGISRSCESMRAAGTAHVGDYAGAGLPLVERAARAAGLGISHFCEWFGMGRPFADELRPWPPACRAILEADRPAVPGEGLVAPLEARCAPAGHALYSTAPDILRDARRWCAAHERVFALHLAESPEETTLLLDGRGPLKDFYDGVVLPSDWRAPGLRPLALAMKWELLGQGTLAVHGTQLDAGELAVLAAGGSALCLCPRSNACLGVGLPPVRDAVESGVLLCLGTDGLSSNTDMDVRQEALFLRERYDLPPEVLLRLLTVNGAAALALPALGRLEAGMAACWSLLPEALCI